MKHQLTSDRGVSHPAGTWEREFVYTWEHFEYLRDLSREHSGIIASDDKFDMYYARLARCLRAMGMSDFGDYCALLASGDRDTFVDFINAITTNLTSFFREMHHFDYLRWNILPELVQQNSQSRRIRIWSAGCSTGEEPYSLAIVLNETLKPQIAAEWDIKILATDIDSNVLDQCKKGLYTADRVSGIPASYLRTGFLRGKSDQDGFVHVNPDVQDLIRFKQLNLMDSWPMKGRFDLIFCRNVIIYFDRQTKAQLISRFADALTDNGHLCIGHSESLYRISSQFELLSNTIYRKKCA